MKTILMLTDFSANADRAAHYALKLAQKVEANLLLCNIYSVPSDGQMENRAEWPLENDAKNSIEGLGELAAELKNQMDKDVDEKNFRPDIQQCSKNGSIANVFNDITSSYDIVMAVVSIHHIHFFSDFLSVNHTKEIIDHADFPVLVVPHQARFKNYKTIAFATDMSDTDINVLRSLSGFARYADAKVIITHITDPEGKKEEKVKKFLDQVAVNIDYPKVFYSPVKNADVSGSLKKLQAYNEIDMLVLVYRKRNFFQKLYEGKVIQYLLKNPVKPLLIFPYMQINEKLPVF